MEALSQIKCSICGKVGEAINQQPPEGWKKKETKETHPGTSSKMKPFVKVTRTYYCRTCPAPPAAG